MTDIVDVIKENKELIDVVSKYTQPDWYSMFLTMFLSQKGVALDDMYHKIRNALGDAFAISTVKKRYEENETHRRIWE